MEFDLILERIAAGESLRAIATDIGIHEATIRTALRRCPELSARYDEAQQERTHLLADEILELADSATMETLAQVRLQVDARKWTLARLHPKMYGERVRAELSGAVAGSHETAVRAMLTNESPA